jgi:hypothetical protein
MLSARSSQRTMSHERSQKKKLFRAMRDWPGSGLKGRGADYNRAPARPGGARRYSPVLASGAWPGLTRSGAIACFLNFFCARIAETWAHRFGIIPQPAAPQQTQSPPQVCVGASVWEFFLARLHWRQLSWPVTHFVCSLPEEWTDGRDGRHQWCSSSLAVSYDTQNGTTKNARVSLHMRARMHTGRWRSSETE